MINQPLKVCLVLLLVATSSLPSLDNFGVTDLVELANKVDAVCVITPQSGALVGEPSIGRYISVVEEILFHRSGLKIESGQEVAITGRFVLGDSYLVYANIGDKGQLNVVGILDNSPLASFDIFSVIHEGRPEKVVSCMDISFKWSSIAPLEVWDIGKPSRKKSVYLFSDIKAQTKVSTPTPSGK